MKFIHIAIALAFVSPFFMPVYADYICINMQPNIICTGAFQINLAKDILGAEYFIRCTSQEQGTALLPWNREYANSLTFHNDQPVAEAHRYKPFILITNNGDVRVMRWWQNYQRQCTNARRGWYLLSALGAGLCTYCYLNHMGCLPAISPYMVGTAALSGIGFACIWQTSRNMLKQIPQTILDWSYHLGNSINSWLNNNQIWRNIRPVDQSLATQSTIHLTAHSQQNSMLPPENVRVHYTLVECPELNQRLTKYIHSTTQASNSCPLCHRAHQRQEGLSFLPTQGHLNQDTVAVILPNNHSLAPTQPIAIHLVP